MGLEIHTIPSISLAHITQAVNDRFDKNDNPWCVHATYQGAGYFIYLDEPYCGNAADPVPQCLLDIRDWRMSLEKQGILDNSLWVRVDTESDPVEGLPVYDWQ